MKLQFLVTLGSCQSFEAFICTSKASIHYSLFWNNACYTLFCHVGK